MLTWNGAKIRARPQTGTLLRNLLHRLCNRLRDGSVQDRPKLLITKGLK
jgi:hypothetical protein